MLDGEKSPNQSNREVRTVATLRATEQDMPKIAPSASERFMSVIETKHIKAMILNGDDNASEWMC